MSEATERYSRSGNGTGTCTPLGEADICIVGVRHRRAVARRVTRVPSSLMYFLAGGDTIVCGPVFLKSKWVKTTL